MAVLSFQLEGQQVLSRNLRILADGIEDMRPEFKEIGDMIEKSAQTNFENEGSEGGGKWKSLSPATVKARQKKTWYYKNSPSGASANWPILRWTGRLASSFVKNPGKMEVAVWNNAPYYKYHQSKNRSGKLPRRLILELKQNDKRDIVAVIWKGINKRMKNFWRQF